MVLATEPKPSVKAEVERRIDEGQCLQCDRPAGTKMRQLCPRCYYRWYRGQGGLTEAQKLEKNSKLIRQGKLLKSRQGQRLTKKAS